MTTKFDIGDDVFVTARIQKIYVGNDYIRYEVVINDTDTHLLFYEDSLLLKCRAIARKGKIDGNKT